MTGRMKRLISCGTCEHEKNGEKRENYVCEMCFQTYLQSGFQKQHSKWEDALPCRETRRREDE